MVGHIAHLPVVAKVQPLLQAAGLVVQGLRFGKADEIETKAEGFGADEVGMVDGGRQVDLRLTIYDLRWGEGRENYWRYRPTPLMV
jgi:hypothetical protein